MASSESDVLFSECDTFLKNIILDLDKSKNMSTELKNNITKNVKDIKSVVKCLKNMFKSQKNEILLSTQQNEKRYIDMHENIAKELVN